MAEWFERFFAAPYAKLLGVQFDEAQTRRQTAVVRRLLRLRRGHRVLDIPCGMGRLTLPLAKAGMVMTGQDLAGVHIRRARRLAKQAGVNVRFVRRDMRDIRFDGELHAVFNWFGSFGYFSDDGNLTFCSGVFRSLKPGGRFLVEGRNKSHLLAHFQPRSESTFSGIRVLTKSRWDPRTSRVEEGWTLIDGPQRTRLRSSIKVFNGSDMRAILRAAGFRDVQLYGRGRQSDPFFGRLTRHSRRWIAVARRPR
jgi:SAM-dependent methyltransferase